MAETEKEINHVHAVIEKELKAARLSESNSKIKSMLMYSGGADSFSLAKGLLEATEHEIILHHVVIRNREKRDQFQLKTLDKQFDYLRKTTREFQVLKSAYEIPLETKQVGLDRTTCLFFGARACAAMRNQVAAVYTGCIEPQFWELHQGSSVLNSVFVHLRYKPSWLRPFKFLARQINQGKSTIYKNIGEEGLNLTVSCRNPKSDGEKFISCLKCHACKLRAKTVESLGWDKSLVK